MNNPFFNPIMTNFRQNPMAALRRAGYNIPGNIGDPREIIQYMMNSGQISQAQLNNIRAMAQRMGARF